MCHCCHDVHRNCGNKADIVLTANLERPESTAGELVPLPLTQDTCEYTLNTLGGFGCNEFAGPQLIIKNKCRKLKVEGTVTGGQVVITVQTGEETPRVFSFVDTEFELNEDLVKGDKITFQYESDIDTIIQLKALVVKKYCV